MSSTFNVLIIGTNNYARGRLKAATVEAGLYPIIARPDELTVEMVDSDITVFLNDQPVVPDGVIHIMSTDFYFALRALDVFSGKIPILNPPEAVLRSADKFSTAIALSRFRVPHPRTFLTHHNKALINAAQKYGYPVVIKQPDGSEGNEVGLSSSSTDLDEVVDVIGQRGNSMLVQEFVAESFGVDLRVIVVGGKVIAQMERRAQSPEEFRSNLHKGGRGFPVNITAQEAEVAIKAAEAVGLDVAGVDILRSKRGPLVVETNSFPGLQGIESVTGVDVAGSIVNLLLHRLTQMTSAGVALH